MWSLHPPISLWVIWHCPQLLHAKEHTHFINDAAHEVSTPIAQEPGCGPEDWDIILIRNLVTVLAVWLGATYAIMCFMKWSWNTRMLATLGSQFSSMVISMLVKSMCKRSNGAVATIRCRGTLGKSPSCCRQHTQFCIWLIIPGHQKHSHSNDKVWSWPWWSASLWHPFKVATWWALGTTNSSKSSVFPLGIECRYKAPWWVTKFCRFCKIIQPSSLEVYSARRAFKSVFFLSFSQSNTELSTGSSLWASA